ncbi:MAG: hypothetical protein J1F38_01535 [Muribaculaceae bacterium]|nr:hypothetical protein [Muribaculaceae bacterium]
MRYFSFLLFLMIGAVSAMAHYSIHSASPGVTIESSGKSLEAKKGAEIKANDFLIIPEGGEVEIYNDLDKNIYKSLKPGKISVTRLMIDAKKTASDNSKNVASRLRLKKDNGGEIEGEKIYVEKGMVRRSLAVFDPEADNIQVNSKTLGRQIAKFLSSPDSTGYNDVAVKFSKGPVDSVGIFFRIMNPLEFPVYFNVLKFDSTPNENSELGLRTVEISSLGQPDGSYVLLPSQALTKESLQGIPSDERHLIVVTHVRYDLDEVVDETVQALKNKGIDKEEAPEFPLMIMEL